MRCPQCGAHTVDILIGKEIRNSIKVRIAQQWLHCIICRG
jgi:Zn finger protein HypA/HybF involved in hydrogenase expression